MRNNREMANALRFLAIDAVEEAASGHPGMPMGMADIATVLWRDYLQHNPANPSWPNRDRFVLSNGHGSMLLYGLLHLTGYAVSVEDLRQFRQVGSITPGHPELGITPGVEATTGPLGQGLANAVGMALAEKILAQTYNREGFPIVDHYTYAFVGDGCLMEGISHEVSSLAGTLALHKLIVLWDNNGISIDGEVDPWFGEDVAARYRAYGFHVIEGVDGHDHEAIARALDEARASSDRPTLIACRTQIGKGSPNKAGGAGIHGAPLGAAEVEATRAALGWAHAPFDIPASIRDAWDARAEGEAREQAWQRLWQDYQATYPACAAALVARSSPPDIQGPWQTWMEAIQAEGIHVATRKASQQSLAFLQPYVAQLFGGSADLTASNLTTTPATIAVKDSWQGANYLHYGVREFGMFAIANGLAAYGGFIPFVSTFLTFVDYGKNALRLAAMNHNQVIYVLTHDSIGLGEDGPTHQPVEHIASLRGMPNVTVWRPCDAVETAWAWKAALDHTQGPTALLLSRQTLPAQARSAHALSAIGKGGYVLQSAPSGGDCVIIATGSEVALAMEAAAVLGEQGWKIQVVSMPCMETFLAQDRAYRDQVIPPTQPARVVIEAGIAMGWESLLGAHGLMLGVEHYGASGPANAVYEAMGLSLPMIVKRIQQWAGSIPKKEEIKDGN